MARIGRYGVSSGEPGVRLNDFGTVTTATTGQRSITGLSTVLNEGWQFWGLVVTGTATPILSGTSSNLGQNVLGSDTFATTTAKQAFSEVGPTTLPNPADGTLQSAGAPMVFFQLAA